MFRHAEIALLEKAKASAGHSSSPKNDEWYLTTSPDFNPAFAALPLHPAIARARSTVRAVLERQTQRFIHRHADLLRSNDESASTARVSSSSGGARRNLGPRRGRGLRRRVHECVDA